jgi:outer membrane protein OmpA-like peptidoglycan-associated protein
MLCALMLAVVSARPGTGLAVGTGAGSDASGAPLAAPRQVRRELDRAEALLRERLAELPDGSGVVVRRDVDRLTLRIPARLLFDPDSASLKTDALLSVPLSAALRLLKRRHALQARVEVYTDGIGGVTRNLGFSEQRAQALSAALSAAGIAASRLQKQGLGAAAALASDETPQGRIENRRVEIVFQRAVGAAAAAPAPATALTPKPAATP